MIEYLQKGLCHGFYIVGLLIALALAIGITGGIVWALSWAFGPPVGKTTEEEASGGYECEDHQS